MLDNRQCVTWTKITRHDCPVVDYNRFEYRPELGWKWVQRIIFKFLKWLGAYHLATVSTFTRTPQQNDNLLHSLLGQQGQWIELVHFSKNRPRIYMGPDDFTDLMKLTKFLDYTPATFEGRIRTSYKEPNSDPYERHYDYKWHDIPITVVPWMVGTIIVPE